MFAPLTVTEQQLKAANDYAQERMKKTVLPITVDHDSVSGQALFLTPAFELNTKPEAPN